MKIEEIKIKQGVYLYDGKVPVRVILYETNFSSGSGDYEDPKEIREDKVGKFYGYKYESAGTPGVFNNGGFGGCYKSEKEATKAVEKQFPSIIWN